MSTDLRHVLGEEGERAAARHLERCGFAILDRRYRTRWGELDLVAFDGTTLVFAEVKTRRSRTRSPLEAITVEKARRVRRMAAAWLSEVRERPHGPELRFDAIAVVLDARDRLCSLEHLEGCF